MIEAIFEDIDREIPGAGVVDLMAAEGFFMFGEAIPGMFGIGRGGDSPEIELMEAVSAGVDHFLDGDDGACGEVAMSVVGGSMNSVANAIVVVN